MSSVQVLMRFMLLLSRMLDQQSMNGECKSSSQALVNLRPVFLVKGWRRGTLTKVALEHFGCLFPHVEQD